MSYEALRRDLQTAGFEPDDELSLWSRQRADGYCVVEFRTVTAQRTMDLLHAAGVQICPEAHAEVWRRESRAIEKPRQDPRLLDRARELVDSYKGKLRWRLGTDPLQTPLTTPECRTVLDAYRGLRAMGVAAQEARQMLRVTYGQVYHLATRVAQDDMRNATHRLATGDGDL